MSDEDAAPTYTIRIRERASRDYEAAITRIADLEGEEAARKWDAAYIAAVASLATNPRRYAIPDDVAGFAGRFAPSPSGVRPEPLRIA